MTYSKLYRLKYLGGISTHELMRQFPGEIQKISEVALLDLDNGTLREVLPHDERLLNRIQRLKRIKLPHRSFLFNLLGLRD